MKTSIAFPPRSFSTSLKTSKSQGVTTKLESRLDQGNGIETSLKKGTFLRLECHQLG
ncbi:hypothetical protein H6G67_32015, partial [Leptolyngbya sp. FACHB-239]|nr:hypothetical protein [Leptolyngbya sp. FACHB-238]MBD2402284.1 hypothetical protein [Leptolyngbya sp. FACHB-239]